MKPSAILAFALLLSACGVARPVLESDNTKVEVKTVVERVVDTAYVELPVIVEKVATLGTASVLENKYAKSAALVSGELTHSLATKPVREPERVEKGLFTATHWFTGTGLSRKISTSRRNSPSGRRSA